jgi:hypothetical protein
MLQMFINLALSNRDMEIEISESGTIVDICPHCHAITSVIKRNNIQECDHCRRLF